MVCGPSGSGKSTLIKTVNALEPIQGGDILIDGASVTGAADLPKLRTKVGMVFQHFELFPHLDIMRNLTLAQQIVLRRDLATARGKAGALLERVGLSGARRQAPRAVVAAPAAARRDRPGARDAPQGDAVRRAHLGVGSGDGQRSAGRDGRTRRGGHDHGRGHPRDGLRAPRRQSRDLHGRRRASSRTAPPTGFFRDAASPQARRFLSKILPH